MAAQGAQNGSPARGAQFLALRDAAALAGCHGSTVRRAADSGELKVYKLPSGHRRFLRSDPLAWINSEKSQPKSAGVVAIYARVSTNDQAKGFSKGGKDNDLARQIERLKRCALDDYQCKHPLIYKDVLSGLNYQRRGLTTLLGDAINGKLNGATLLITQKDRLARFGTELILYLLNQYEVRVVFTEKQDLEEKEELAEDLLAIIHHFSSKLYGGRSSGARKRTLEAATIKRAKNLLDQGHALTVVLEKLRAEKHRTKEGHPLSYHILYKHVYKNAVLETYLPAESPSILDQYFSKYLRTANRDTRIIARHIYEHFCSWAERENLEPVTRRTFSVALAKKGYERGWSREPAKSPAYIGLKIEGADLHYTLKRPRRNEQDLASPVRAHRDKTTKNSLAQANHGGHRSIPSALGGGLGWAAARTASGPGTNDTAGELPAALAPIIRLR